MNFSRPSVHGPRHRDIIAPEDDLIAGNSLSRGDDMATIEKYCAPGVYDTPSYSQAIKVTGAQTILFLAGQVPYAPDGTVNHIGNFMGQARQVFGAVKALVEHAGGTLDNVVKITTFVTDVRRRMDFRLVRDEFFGVRGPASTMVEVSSLSHPDYLIEIEAVAIL
jgi:enamine deaminase RidA (YjgF/YER057c/UK114 family)